MFTDKLKKTFEEIITNEENNSRALAQIVDERLRPLFENISAIDSKRSFFKRKEKENEANAILNKISQATDAIRKEQREFKKYADYNASTMRKILARNGEVTELEYRELPENLRKYMDSATKIADYIEIIKKEFEKLNDDKIFSLLSKKKQRLVRIAQGYMTQDEFYACQHGDVPGVQNSRVNIEWDRQVQSSDKFTHPSLPLISNLIPFPFQRVGRVPMAYKQGLKHLEGQELPTLEKLFIKLLSISSEGLRVYNEVRDVTLPESVDLNIVPQLNVVDRAIPAETIQFIEEDDVAPAILWQLGTPSRDDNQAESSETAANRKLSR